MALLTSVVSFLCSLFITPLLMFLLGMVFLASINRSLGIRKLYIRLLLKLFEYGKQHIEIAKRGKDTPVDDSDADDDKGGGAGGGGGVGDWKTHRLPMAAPSLRKNNSMVITREDLILQPDPEMNYNGNNNLAVPNGNASMPPGQYSAPTAGGNPASDQHEFELSDCLTFIRTGVEAIIEDQVTSRFEAEELRSWNLLTRTNMHYEFISWRLTVIWMCGFFMRYCFLLPLRVIILTFGFTAAILNAFLISLFPECKFKRNVASVCMRIYVHMIAIGLSFIVNVHNPQHKPGWGCLVASNHTTVLDNLVLVLGTGRSFSMVLVLVVSTALIGQLPESKWKRRLASLAFLVAMRIAMRSQSVVMTMHNPEHMPTTGSICVANHTSIIDVGILATQTVFSLTFWMTLCTAVVGLFPEGRFKKWLNEYVSGMCFTVLSHSVTSVFEYHNIENRPQAGICVANHTTPIDVLVLACDNTYSLIGQRHGGFLGILQRALARASPHIWFERFEVKDRLAVARRIREHVTNPENPPVLIFPEGTCINNTSVMQFKKGSFEVGSIVYPVAIKYDPRFGDAFWNSSKYSMLQYLYCTMTSWAIVCDVWYLPPMQQQEGESSVDFANRVKHAIAEQGGLVDLVWDGQLKRIRVKPEWKLKQQEEFSKRIKVD